MQVSAENNLQILSLNTGNISKCYRTVLHWLKDYNLRVKVIVEMCTRSVLRCVKFQLLLDNTHHATNDKDISQISNEHYNFTASVFSKLSVLTSHFIINSSSSHNSICPHLFFKSQFNDNLCLHGFQNTHLCTSILRIIKSSS